MDVEHPSGIPGDELRRENAHEARQHNEVRMTRVERLAQSMLERFFPTRPGHCQGLDAKLASDIKTCDAGAVRYHDSNVSVNLPGEAGACNSGHVGATTGDQD